MLDSTIRAADSANLQIDCLGLQACNNLKIYCPEIMGSAYQKPCVMNGGNNDVHQRLQFYAKHGFDDLNTENYDGLLLNSSINGKSKSMNLMHCGNDYSSKCVLNKDFYCECDDVSVSESSEDGNNDGGGDEELLLTQPKKVLGLSAGSLAAVLVIGCIICCFFLSLVCYFNRINQPEKKKYESVEETNDDEEVEHMYGGDMNEHNVIKSKWTDEDDDDEEQRGFHDRDVSLIGKKMIDVDFAHNHFYKKPKKKSILLERGDSDDNEYMVSKSAL